MNEVEIQYLIMETVAKHRPESVEALIDLILKETNLSKSQVIENIVTLEKQDKLKLLDSATTLNKNFQEYLLSTQTLGFWGVAIICIASAITILVDPSNIVITYARYILGSFLILFLPGYTLMKALFPLRKLFDLENLVLSVGMSIVLTPIMGLILNYTPWGVRLWSITLSLILLTIILSLVGAYRNYTQLK